MICYKLSEIMLKDQNYLEEKTVKILTLKNGISSLEVKISRYFLFSL